MRWVHLMKKVAMISFVLMMIDGTFRSYVLANSVVPKVTVKDPIAQAASDLKGKFPLTKGVIPKNAVRLRIIANSDSPEDQQLKRDVRDQIVASVGKLLQGVSTQEQAESILSKAVPKLDQLAQTVIQREGYSYSTRTKVGVVPFPTKLYGNQVYPAGNYEALQIIIGKGKGQNWWCVLFPALCFIDLENGDAVPNTKDFPDSKPITTIQVAKAANGQAETVQVRFAFLDYGKKLITGIEHMFDSFFRRSTI